MKNNRSLVSEQQTAVFVSQLGDPSKFTLMENLKDEGEYEIECLDIRTFVGKKAYRALKNNPDKFTVVLEEDHALRDGLYAVVRYVRKTQCLLEDLVPELKPRSATPSPPSSTRSPVATKPPERKAKRTKKKAKASAKR